MEGWRVAFIAQHVGGNEVHGGLGLEVAPGVDAAQSLVFIIQFEVGESDVLGRSQPQFPAPLHGLQIRNQKSLRLVAQNVIFKLLLAL